MPPGSFRFHVLQELEDVTELHQQVVVNDSNSLEVNRPASNMKNKQPALVSSKPRVSSAPALPIVQPGGVLSTGGELSTGQRVSVEQTRITPMVVGDDVQEVAVRAVPHGGNHKAALIVEEGQDLCMPDGGNIVSLSRAKSKRKTNASSKGLRIQKKSDFKIPTKPTLAEWMSLVPEKSGMSGARDVPMNPEDSCQPPIAGQLVTSSSLPVGHASVASSSVASDCVLQV
ncbi:hypothetical protein V6N13_114674 [Hibiscus sabdariffa]